MSDKDSQINSKLPSWREVPSIDKIYSAQELAGHLDVASIRNSLAHDISAISGYAAQVPNYMTGAVEIPSWGGATVGKFADILPFTGKRSSSEYDLEWGNKLLSRMRVLEGKIDGVKNLTSEVEGRIPGLQKKLESVEEANTKANETAQGALNLAQNAKEEAEKKIKELGLQVSRLENQKIRIIETLGIFVALFTFISTEFQVYKIFQDPQTIAGLSLIILGSLLIFVTILDVFLLHSLDNKDLDNKDDNKEGRKIRIIFIAIWIFFIVGGGYLFITSKETEDKYIKFNREDYGSYIDRYININDSVNKIENENLNVQKNINSNQQKALEDNRVLGEKLNQIEKRLDDMNKTSP